MRTMKKCDWIILASAIIAIIIAPVIFTRPAVCEQLSFIGTGEIGDTIGGITAPIIGLVSIFLLVRTLKAQLDFNETQARDNVLEQIHMLQSQIIQMDERFVFYYYTDTDRHSCKQMGISSLKYLENWNDNTVWINVLQMKSILGQLETFISLCNCYKQRIKDTTFNVSIYEDVINGYKQQIEQFLNAVIWEHVDIRDNPCNSYRNDSDKSEIDMVRTRAEKLLSKL